MELLDGDRDYFNRMWPKAATFLADSSLRYEHYCLLLRVKCSPYLLEDVEIVSRLDELGKAHACLAPSYQRWLKEQDVV